jgi:sulfate transport system ATP-binding protein
MTVLLDRITKRFGAVPALSAIDLTIAEGEFLALLGPSGSGKTTLLRIIAGLEAPDGGRVLIGGHDATRLAPRERGIGFVFQHYALFRHMSVFDNIAFGLSVRRRTLRPRRSEIRRRVEELLELVQLQGLGRRLPAQLSGGQRQRVALARALAVEPKVLLLDEPFGALDAKVRHELRAWLHALHQRLGLTSVFVTHDQEEALELADRVAVLRAGQVEQVDTPAAVYDRPANGFVLQFLGSANRVSGRLAARLGPAGRPEAPGFVRPEDVRLAPATASGEACLGVVRTVGVIGPRARVAIELDGERIEAEVARRVLEDLSLAAGSRIAVSFERVHGAE